MSVDELVQCPKCMTWQHTIYPCAKCRAREGLPVGGRNYGRVLKRRFDGSGPANQYGNSHAIRGICREHIISKLTEHGTVPAERLRDGDGVASPTAMWRQVKMLETEGIIECAYFPGADSLGRPRTIKHYRLTYAYKERLKDGENEREQTEVH